MDGAIRNFCDQVSVYGPLRLQECGINEKHQFVYGRTVNSIDNGRLIRELTKYPALNHIVGKTMVTKYELPVNYHYLATGAEKTTGAEKKTLPGQVTLVTCNEGLLTWVGLKNGEEAYGIVSSVDRHMQLDRGIAEAIKNRFGGNGSYYHRASQQRQIQFGECFTYDYISEVKPPDLTNCQTVHNVLVPLSSDRSFAAMLKKAVLEVFKEADGRGLKRIFCPLLGCGRASGSGAALAKAVLAAKVDFESTGRLAPELILVGRSSEAADIKACRDFARQWQASGPLNPAIPSIPSTTPATTPATPSTGSPVSRVKTPASTGASAIKTVTSAGGGDNRSRVLIPDQLEIAMNPVDGMFGYARELSKQGVPFDLVNAANRDMNHGGGIALRFVNELGAAFNQKTRENLPVQTGACLTTGPYGYASEPRFGLRHCQHIHNVVAPNKCEYDVSVNSSVAGRNTPSELLRYQQDFTNAFVSLLLASSNHGGSTIVSCFIGCAIFGGNGSDMAVALHEAYQDPRIQRLAKVPKLILVGWKGATDSDVYDNFIRIFKSLNRSDPLRLPLGSTPASASGSAITKRASSYLRPGLRPGAALPASLVSAPRRRSMFSSSDEMDLARLSTSSDARLGRTGVSRSGARFAARSGARSDESATSAFGGGEKTIKCDVCHESKPEKGSQQYQGLQLCSGCTKYYRKQGHDLSAKLAEEYTAINYQPLIVFRSITDLEGYPGAGRIVVGIDATAPARLSDGRMLDITRKNETHYLPDNELGNELFRLLKVLHEEKLIYKIDQSNTTGRFGITFNVHLKTSDTGGVHNHGYPDESYPQRAVDEILGLAKTHSLGHKLDVSKLVSWLSDKSS